MPRSIYQIILKLSAQLGLLEVSYECLEHALASYINIVRPVTLHCEYAKHTFYGVFCLQD